MAGSPQGHGYLRPTWTQELLVLVLAEICQAGYPTLLGNPQPCALYRPLKVAASEHV